MLFNKKIKKSDPSSPMDLCYMKRLKFYLNLMSGWPFEDLYETYREKPKRIPLRSSKCIIVYWILIFTTGFLYIKAHIRELNFFELGHTYILVFMNLVALQRSTMPLMKSYRTMMSQFVLKFHLFHHKERSDYANKIYKRIHTLSTYFTIILYFQMYVGCFLFNITPVFNNIQSGAFKSSQYLENGTNVHVRYEYSVYHYIPFEINFRGYWFLFILNVILTLDGASNFCTYDVLMSIIIFHVWGHLKILKYHIENFPKPSIVKHVTGSSSIKMTVYSPEEIRQVLSVLKENIEHHKFIMQFMNLASSAMGIMMCCYYLLHQVIGCILLLELSSLSTQAFASYGALAFIMFQQLIQFSIIFELIRTESEAIKHAVYEIPWECMDVRSRKIFLFFLYNAQTPITLKAMGMVSVGVQTMATILKTSFSYFIMLRTFTEN